MLDLFRPYVNEGAALIRLSRVLSADEQGRRYIGQGDLVDEFERRFAALVGAPDPDAVISTNSCTSALGIALQLAGVGPGDEVIAPPMTCTATSGAIINRGARIVWADVLPHTGLIDPADVARKVTPRTRAIVAVDWGGRACDYRALRCAWSESREVFDTPNFIPIIEDAAHALLATEAGQSVAWQDRPSCYPVGGDYVCYSLGPIKHLTSGDGGMLVTHRGDQDRARLLRWHGLSRRTKADFRCEQDITEVGGKHHMTDLNAAIGLANIDHAEWIVARHRLSAEWYCRVLRGCPGITVPPYGPGSSYWLMGLLVEDRDGFASYMTSHGVQVSRAHRRNDEHTAFRAVSWGWPLPGVEYFDAHQINIPAGWWVSEQDREYVAAVITDWAHGRREAA